MSNCISNVTLYGHCHTIWTGKSPPTNSQILLPHWAWKTMPIFGSVGGDWSIPWLPLCSQIFAPTSRSGLAPAAASSTPQWRSISLQLASPEELHQNADENTLHDCGNKDMWRVTMMVLCVCVCVCVQVSKTVFVYTSDINNENIVISIFHKYCHLCVCARAHERAKGSCATSPCTLCRSDFHQRMFCGGWWIRTVFQECRKVIGKHICVTVPRVHLVGTDRYKSHACSRMCILQILV